MSYINLLFLRRESEFFGSFFVISYGRSDVSGKKELMSGVYLEMMFFNGEVDMYISMLKFFYSIL